MNVRSAPQPLTWPAVAWSCAALMGGVAPVGAMLWLAQGASPALSVAGMGPILAIGLMGTGMIAAAAAARLSVGVTLAFAVGAGLVLIAQALGLPTLPHGLAIGVAILVASVSFAARGTLFATSMGGKGWGMAVFVVAGEAAIVLTALAQPDALPDWLLALLPAQWASLAVQAALSDTGLSVAWAALVALSGTAAATLLVASLWPKRWPYLVMFTSWLSLSALVYYTV